MGKKLTALALSGMLFAGVPSIVSAPCVKDHIISIGPVKQIDPDALANPQLEKERKEIAYKMQIANYMPTLEKEMKAEQEAKLDRNSPQYDSLYSTVVWAFDFVENHQGIKIPSYLTPEFIRAEILVESSDVNTAVSWVGAKGPLQMTWPAAKETGVSYKRYHDNNQNSPMFDPSGNIDSAMVYYSKIIDGELSKKYFGWDKLSKFEKQMLAAQSFNGGYHLIINHRNEEVAHLGERYLSLFPQETKEYFPKIMRAEAKLFPYTFAYNVLNLSLKDLGTLENYFAEPFVNSVPKISNL